MSKTIIEMAKEAGLFVHARKNQVRVGMDVITGDDSTTSLERFATLVRDDERENRQWRDLTDDEIKQIVNDCTSDDHGYDIWCDGRSVASAVIAKFKEKQL